MINVNLPVTNRFEKEKELFQILSPTFLGMTGTYRRKFSLSASVAVRILPRVSGNNNKQVAAITSRTANTTNGRGSHRSAITSTIGAKMLPTLLEVEHIPTPILL